MLNDKVFIPSMLVTEKISPLCWLKSYVGSGSNPFPEYPINPSPIVKTVFPPWSLKSRSSNVNSESSTVGELKSTYTRCVYMSETGLVNRNCFSLPKSASVIWYPSLGR